MVIAHHQMSSKQEDMPLAGACGPEPNNRLGSKTQSPEDLRSAGQRASGRVRGIHRTAKAGRQDLWVRTGLGLEDKARGGLGRKVHKAREATGAAVSCLVSWGRRRHRPPFYLLPPSVLGEGLGLLVFQS